MSLSLNQKEDLRLKLVYLEKKLAESEDERCKLEKTCNVLMRAFREEEKMRYKALNTEYEKFLQDCTVRRRRNELILRSLCKIEDRSKALFAKTERLKLLKDRYISYMKITDIKKREIPSQFSKTFLFSSLSQNITNDETPKLVQWKDIPTDPKGEELERIKRNLFRSDESSNVISNDSVSMVYLENHNREQTENIQGYEVDKNSGRNGFNGLSSNEAFARMSLAKNKLDPVRTTLNSIELQANFLDMKLKSKKLLGVSNHKKQANCSVLIEADLGDEFGAKNSPEVVALKSSDAITHRESIEKLKQALSLEKEYGNDENIYKKSELSDDEKTEKKIDIEHNEKGPIRKQNNSCDVMPSSINKHVTNCSSKSSAFSEETQEKHSGLTEIKLKSESEPDSQEKNRSGDTSPRSNKSLPMGLDGVDYQNETYPESYYEQPVYHHNHTSIVADVILEEDETEQDADEREKDLSADHDSGKIQMYFSSRDDSRELNTWENSSGCRILNEPHCKNACTEVGQANNSHFVCERTFDEVDTQVENQDFGFEKSLETKRSTSEPGSHESEGLGTDKLANKTGVKSNLIHLLESDSESFQIEHGDTASGNEGSDFDFSFH